LITLDLASPVPPFEQVRSQIAAQVSAGTLAAGAPDCKPPLRTTQHSSTISASPPRKH